MITGTIKEQHEERIFIFIGISFKFGFKFSNKCLCHIPYLLNFKKCIIKNLINVIETSFSLKFLPESLFSDIFINIFNGIWNRHFYFAFSISNFLYEKLLRTYELFLNLRVWVQKQNPKYIEKNVFSNISQLFVLHFWQVNPMTLFP